MLNQRPNEWPLNPLQQDIQRRIGNSTRVNANSHVFRGSRCGMEDFAFVAEMLQHVTDEELQGYLVQIDAIAAENKDCRSCYLKVIAFCFIFCQGRLPDQARQYWEKYSSRYSARPDGRDHFGEVRDAISRYGSAARAWVERLSQ